MSVLHPDLIAGAFVCRHKAGRWNSVPSAQFGQCSHPLKTDNDDLYNIFNGQVALTKVNVTDSKLTSPVNTMEHLKKGVRIGDKVVFDLESIFLLLLIVDQQRDMELMPIFGYELCAVPPSLVHGRVWLPP